MKILRFITIFLILCFTTFARAETITVTVSEANIRSGPGTEYKIIGSAKRGENLKSIEKREGWIKFRLKGGKEGWIAERLVVLRPAQTLRVRVEKENLRKTPGGQKIGVVFKNTELKVIEEEGRWVEVEITGWIWKDSTTAKGIEVEKASEETMNKGTSIKGGFSYKNVKLIESMGRIKVFGEMTNHSGKNFKACSFIITFYDRKGKLLETGNFLINNFLNGQTKPFYTYIENLNEKSIYRYKIEFDFGI